MSSHGADVEEIKRKYDIDSELIDFSSNINPFTPLNIVDYINNSIHKITSYPDIGYMDLRTKISETINYRYCSDFTYKNICVGNGATEIIFLLMKYIKGKVGIISPTFSEYERAAKIFGLDYENIQMKDNDKGFEICIDEELISNFRALFICNPNNPDGCLRDLSEIVRIAKNNDLLLIIDETFIEFCDDEIKYSLINSDYENIVILRAITKFYGIPGIRLGYCISKNIQILDSLWSIKEPWTVNSIADGVTQVILEDIDFIKESKERYRVERDFLVKELNKIDGISVYNTDSAFILLKIINTEKIDSFLLKEKLIINYGIIIREASTFSGLDNSFIRVAIKNREDNISLINALKDIFI